MEDKEVLFCVTSIGEQTETRAALKDLDDRYCVVSSIASLLISDELFFYAFARLLPKLIEDENFIKKVKNEAVSSNGIDWDAFIKSLPKDKTQS